LKREGGVGLNIHCLMCTQLFPRPGIDTRAGKFLSQVGKNTATPSTKYVLKTLMNYRQKKKKKKKQKQTKSQIKEKEKRI